MTIYFIKADEAVKIGYTKWRDPYERLRILQNAHYMQLELLGTMDGELLEEKAIHKKFSNIRLRGEWYEYTLPLSRFIHENCHKIYHKILKDK